MNLLIPRRHRAPLLSINQSHTHTHTVLLQQILAGTPHTDSSAAGNSPKQMHCFLLLVLLSWSLLLLSYQHCEVKVKQHWIKMEAVKHLHCGSDLFTVEQSTTPSLTVMHWCLENALTALLEKWNSSWMECGTTVKIYKTLSAKSREDTETHTRQPNTSFNYFTYLKHTEINWT